MKHVIYILAIIGLSGALAWKFTQEPERIETVRIEYDTLRPPPIIVWLKPDKITVHKTDTVLAEMLQNMPQSADVSVSDPGQDSVEVYKAFDVYTRGLDTVYVGTIFYGKPFETFRQEARFNPDHIVIRDGPVDKPVVEILPGVAVGIDARGRFNAVGGVTVSLHLRELFRKLNPFKR